MLKIRSMFMIALLWIAVVAMCAIVGAVAVWGALFVSAVTIAIVICDSEVASTEIKNRKENDEDR